MLELFEVMLTDGVDASSGVDDHVQWVTIDGDTSPGQTMISKGIEADIKHAFRSRELVVS